MGKKLKEFKIILRNTKRNIKSKETILTQGSDLPLNTLQLFGVSRR